MQILNIHVIVVCRLISYNSKSFAVRTFHVTYTLCTIMELVSIISTYVCKRQQLKIHTNHCLIPVFNFRPNRFVVIAEQHLFELVLRNLATFGTPAHVFYPTHARRHLNERLL